MPALTGLLPITTPLALIAFIVAVAFYAYRAHLLQRRRTITSLPANDQIIAVEATLNRFRIDTTGLKNPQKVELALAQIRAQAQRFLIGSIVVCVLAIIAAIVSLASLPLLEHPTPPVNPPPGESHVGPSQLETAMIHVFGESILNLKSADFPNVKSYPWGAIADDVLAGPFVGSQESYARRIVWNRTGQLVSVFYFWKADAVDPPANPVKPPGGLVGPAPAPQLNWARCENTHLKQAYFSLMQALSVTPTITRQGGSNYAYEGTFHNVKIHFEHTEGDLKCKEYIEIDIGTLPVEGRTIWQSFAGIFGD
jgi:hypothetical protein